MCCALLAAYVAVSLVFLLMISGILCLLVLTTFLTRMDAYAAEFASDDWMASYRWGSGGEYKGRPWTPEHPTDSQVCCLLSSARIPAGRG